MWSTPAKGTDVNVKDDENSNTPLMQAVLCLKNPEILSELIQADADVNAINRFGITTLRIAIWENEPEIVLLLLPSGATV